jgi:hypothetical protein
MPGVLAYVERVHEQREAALAVDAADARWRRFCAVYFQEPTFHVLAVCLLDGCSLSCISYVLAA